MMYPGRLGLAGGVAAFLLLCGCVSGDRALRFSPFEQEVQINFDRDSVNLWPLYHSDGKRLSVLWPLFDRDSDGFALRPFYFQEKDERGILFPLSAWNSDWGWALNGYWSGGGSAFGVFPLFHCGPKWQYYGPAWVSEKGNFGFFPLAKFGKGTNYAGPVWWDRNTGRGGLFPVTRFSPRLNYVTLAWWNRKSGDFGFFPLVWKDDRSFLFFPLTRIAPEELSYAGPVWWDRSDRTYGFLPLAMKGATYSNIGPVWWNNREGFRKEGGILPFSYWSNEFNYFALAWWTKEMESWGVFPLVWAFPELGVAGPVWWERGKNAAESGFFPLVWLDRKQGSYLFFPLARVVTGGEGGSDPVPPGSSPFWNNLSYVGPVWWSLESGGFFPLARFGKGINYAGPVWWDRSGESFGFFPLFAKGDDLSFAGPVWWSEDSEECGFFPLFWRFDGGSAVFPLYFYEDRKTGYEFNVGGILWHDSRSGAIHDEKGDVTGYGSRYTHVLWPFFARESDGEKTEWQFWPFVTKRYGANMLPSPLVDWDDGELTVLTPLGFSSRKEKADEEPVRMPGYGAKPQPAEQLLPLRRRSTPLGDDLLREPNISLGGWDSRVGLLLGVHQSGRFRVWRDGVDQQTLERVRERLIDCSREQNVLDDVQKSLEWDRKWLERALKDEKIASPLPLTPAECDALEARLKTGQGKNALSRNRAALARLAASEERLGKMLKELGPDLEQLGLAAPGAPEELGALRKTIAEAFCAEKEYSELDLLASLLYNRTDYGDDFSWRVGPWLAFGRKVGDASELKVLGFLYREKHKGEDSEYQLPGVSYKSAPERFRLNILFGLYRSEENRGKKSGSIFWIPWGEK